MRIRYEDVDVELVESPTMGEIIWAEKQLGSGLDEWTTTQRGVATITLSLRRAEVMLTVADVLALPSDAFEMLADDPAEDVQDPQRAEEATEPPPLAAGEPVE